VTPAASAAVLGLSVLAAKLRCIPLDRVKGADRNIVIAVRCWVEKRGPSFTPAQAKAIERIYAEAVR
jgi:hypothetical protein